MNLKTIHTTWANQWVKITGVSPQLQANIDDFEGTHVFGYVYIDHTAGLSLEIVKLFDEVDGAIVVKDSPMAKKVRVMSRLDAVLTSEDVALLTADEIQHYGLETPEYLTSYERLDLEIFRQDATFHDFRAEGYPDDVQVLLPPVKGLKPELVWARVEALEKKVLSCVLLNEPHQDFGLQRDASLKVSKETIQKTPYLVAHIDVNAVPGDAEVSVAKKPWWKFW